jgi:hypothetical protein
LTVPEKRSSGVKVSFRKQSIYLIGVVILGLAYGPLKERLEAPAFFFCSIIFLLLLRWFAEKKGAA